MRLRPGLYISSWVHYSFEWLRINPKKLKMNWKSEKTKNIFALKLKSFYFCCNFLWMTPKAAVDFVLYIFERTESWIDCNFWWTTPLHSIDIAPYSTPILISLHAKCYNTSKKSITPTGVIDLLLCSRCRLHSLFALMIWWMFCAPSG